MSTEDLNSMQEIDPCIEEIALTVNCSAWNEDKTYHIRDGLLCIVKRTVEPKIQILLKAAWPMKDNKFCRIHWVESSRRFEEEEPRFWFPRPKRGLVVYFDNHASYIRARNCIKSLFAENEKRLGPIQEEEQRDAGPMQEEEQRDAGPSGVIMAMIAVQLATIYIFTINRFRLSENPF